MGRRLSYAEVVASNGTLQRDVSILSVALNLVANTKPDATERVRVGVGQHYTLKLYGATRADGGYVLVTFHCQGQSPHSAAYYLDEYRRQLQHDFPLCAALDRLAIARARLL